MSLTRAAKTASAEGKPMLLYFGRYGCSTCRKMHAEVFTDPGLTETFAQKFVLAYVDTESGNRIRLDSGEVYRLLSERALQLAVERGLPAERAAAVAALLRDDG